MNIKQEHLIYALGVAAIIIVVLLGTVLYTLTSKPATTAPQPGAAPSTGGSQQLPPGHPPIDPNASKQAPPLTPEMMQQLGASTQPANGSPTKAKSK